MLKLSLMPLKIERLLLLPEIILEELSFVVNEQKARQLGMKNTHFVDSTGLRPQNVSTALDLIKLNEASSKFSISKYTTI